jgi:outer membrane protein TolC
VSLCRIEKDKEASWLHALSQAQSLVNLQRLEQQIVVDVDNASARSSPERKRIASTQEARKLAQESLDAGEERLRAGAGTTFEVLELQDKLATAEFAELRARADYNKAIGEYQRQTGTTLRVYNVHRRVARTATNFPD